MNAKNIYYPLWDKYLAVIALQMKNSLNGEREIRLFKNEFEVFANRKNANFLFNLEIIKGKAGIGITGSAVARDLYEKLMMEPKTKELISGNNFKITLAKDFVLRINVMQPAPSAASATSLVEVASA